MLEERGLTVVNATCPFVTNIQKKVKKYSDEGYHIVILGDKKHPEVVGINGWCNDDATITKDGNINIELPDKVCAVAQTTEKKKNWDNTVEHLKDVKELVSYNTICAATDVRQKSTLELSKNVDAMIVIGGKKSSNTTKLYQIAKENCKHTIHIENIKDLPKDFINDDIKKIGVTAGASTPDWIIREVLDIMSIENNVNNEDQLTLMNETDMKIVIGTEVTEKVISKNNEGLVIGMNGYGIDGIIPYNELTAKGDSREFAESINIGDTLTAKVIKLQNNDGFVVLSRLEYEKEEAFKELEGFFNEGKTFEIKINEAKDKGLAGNYKGIRVFIPASQIDIRFTENKEQYLNQTLEVKLIDFSTAKPVKVVASRRVILEKAKNEAEAKAWESFKIGRASCRERV